MKLLLSLFFLLYSVPVCSSVEVDDPDFKTMMEHIENCPIMCNNNMCAQKENRITDKQFNITYRSMYCTYHNITEIDTQKYIINAQYRFFVNYYGELLMCRQKASTKKELMMVPNINNNLHVMAGRFTFRYYTLPEQGTLKELHAPIFNSVQAAKESVERIEYVDYMELLYCTSNDVPKEVIDLIYDIIIEIKRPSYLYSFCRITPTLEMDIAIHGERWFCSLINFTEVQTDLLQNRVLSTLCKRFFVKDTFIIKELYPHIDLYNNRESRLLLLCEHEGESPSYSKYASLLYAEKKNEYRNCGHGQRTSEILRPFTVQQVEENHNYLCKGLNPSAGPLSCYCGQIIYGSSEQIKAYLGTALKRLAIRTLCLYKNEAASTAGGDVFNNPYGQFVIYKNGKAIVLKGCVRDDQVCYVIHTDAVHDATKMQTLSQKYATQWMRTSNNRFIYCHEKDPSELFTQLFPYGGRNSWNGHGGGVCHRNYYKQDGDIELRDGGLESFSAYRIWIVSLTKEAMFALSCQNEIIDFCVIYTDWPYVITAINNDKLTLEYEDSDYTAYLNIPFVKKKKSVEPYVQINIEGQRLNPSYENDNYVLRLEYTYKKREKLEEFKQRRLGRDNEVMRDTINKRKKMGFDIDDIPVSLYTNEGIVGEQDSHNNDAKRATEIAGSGGTDLVVALGSTPLAASVKENNDSNNVNQVTGINNIKNGFSFNSLLRFNTPKFAGGLLVGTVVVGIWWFLQKQRVVYPKLFIPRV